MTPSITTSGNQLLSSYAYQKEEINTYTESSEGGVKTISSYHFESYQASYSVNLGEGMRQPPLVYSASSQDFLSSSSVNAFSAVDQSDQAPLLDGAQNILSAIEQRMTTALEEGASFEELAELLEQGTSGFKQGYGEAVDILRQTEEIEIPEVLDSVSTLYSQVIWGIEALRERFLGDDVVNHAGSDSSAPAPADTKDTPAAVITPAPAMMQQGGGKVNTLSSNSDNVQNGPFKVLNDSVESPMRGILNTLENMVVEVEEATVDYGRKDRFTFELSTLDGDKITIQAVNTGLYAAQTTDTVPAGEAIDGDQAIVEGLKQNSEFDINVDGELDEQEVAAIQDLLQQVMALADEFYNGDIDKAYDAAMALGYDQTEIAGYSLHLKQTEQFTVAAAYQAFDPVTLPAPADKAPFNAIGDFAQNVLSTLNNPSNFQVFDYSQLLTNIAQQIDQQILQDSTTRFSDVATEIVDKTQDEFEGEA